MEKEKKIKCIVWDLDNTIWDGVLLEDSHVVLKENIKIILKEIDNRGILQSIASKNDYKTAIKQLKTFKIDHYFLYPQINWEPKSASIKEIARLINIHTDTVAFIDDQLFEREEVAFSFGDVMCIDPIDLHTLLEMPEMNPKFITKDTKYRRKMYVDDIARNKEENNYEGSQDEFLATLNMIFTISEVQKNELQRAEELTIRTNQLNATGYTYTYEELDTFRKSPTHKLFIAELKDRYGTYGKIGLMLIECNEKIWTLKLFLMSCRVISRGVGTVMLNFLMNLAVKHNVRLLAEFVPTDRNRMMYITYKFAGFKEIKENTNLILLESDLQNIQPIPDYIKLISV